MLSTSFYTLLAEIVRAFPITEKGGEIWPCLRPNAFMVLTHLSELNSQAGGKDARYEHKGYYFSRAFEQTNQSPSQRGLEYPLVQAYELDTHVSGVGNVRTSYRIGVSDLIEGVQNDCTTICSRRTTEEVGESVKQIGIRILQQLKHENETKSELLGYRIYLNTVVFGKSVNETTGTLHYKETNNKEVTFYFDVTVEYTYCTEPFEIQVKPLGRPDRGCC